MKPRQRKEDRLGVDGAVWLTVGGEPFGGRDRIDLLRAIAEQGSITHAAKAVGISYKGAWDAIETMNTLAGAPLVARSAGGRGGGSTQLTEHGRRLVDRFVQIDAAHQRYLKLLDEGSIDLAREFSLLETLNLKTSARNQFVGQVCAVRAGAVNDEIEVMLTGGARIVAIVTRESTRALGLRPELTAFVLLKSSSVMIARGIEGVKISARNQLHGRIVAVTAGSVNAEVELELDGGGGRIAATVSQGMLEDLAFEPGQRATALFKASSVILAVAA